MTEKVLVIGAGGHATVLIDALLLCGIEIVGITDPAPEKQNTTVLGIPVLGDDRQVEGFLPATVLLVNGIGSVAPGGHRIRVFEKFRSAGYRFQTVIHPSAVIARDVVTEPGAQILAGTVVGPRSRICENAIVNTRASIDHDCHIGTHVHVAPGAILCGGVEVGEATIIGSGATIVQSVSVGLRSLVYAGATVISDVKNDSRVSGVPAKTVEK